MSSKRPRIRLLPAAAVAASLAISVASATVPDARPADVPPFPAVPAGAYTDADYLRFADHIAQQLDGTWSDRLGYYESGEPSIDSRYNAALLTVHAVAAAHGQTGASRDDARARGEMRLLRAWVQRDLFGYWTHSGFLSAVPGGAP